MTQVTVRIPGPLRSFTGGTAELKAPAGSVAEIIRCIGESHPQLPARLLTAEGELRPHVTGNHRPDAHVAECSSDRPACR